MIHKPLALLLPLALLALPALPGCASTRPTEVPPQAQSDLDELRVLLTEAWSSLNDTLKLTRALAEPEEGSKPPEVRELVERIAALDLARTQVSATHARAQARAQEYFADWERKLQAMPADLAEDGRERIAASQAAFASLQEAGNELASLFDPFLSGLLESKRYLDTDCTPQGFQVVRSRLEDQLEDAPEVRTAIGRVIGHLDAMRGAR